MKQIEKVIEGLKILSALGADSICPDHDIINVGQTEYVPSDELLSRLDNLGFRPSKEFGKGYWYKCL